MSRAAAFASLLLAAAASAEEELPRTLVREGAAPTLDGALSEGEWADATRLEVTRAGEPLGEGFAKRVGRDLLFAFRGELPPYGLNLRLAFVDPATQRRVVANVAPLAPPMPPLLLHRQRADGAPEPATAAACDVRFGLLDAGGFTVELRLPLDELEIGRAPKAYEWYVQLWNLDTSRALGAFPMTAQGSVVQPLAAPLVGDPDWGLEAPAGEARRNEALALLEELWRESEAEQRGGRGGPAAPVLIPYLGVKDGKRRTEPIQALAERMRALHERYPDYAAFHHQRMRALVGLNDFEGALREMQALGKRFPAVAERGPFVRLVVRVLADMGRFDDALALFDANAKALADQPDAAELRARVETLRAQMAAEEKYRAEDAARGDLPRVKLVTSRGEILLELFEDDAPNAVANFVTLVESGFYDGTRFHWVDAGGQVIGGDPNSRNDDPSDDGFGGPGYMIESEVGRRMHLPFTIGFCDKLRSSRTEGSAFVIAIAPVPVLDGRNTVFGRVIDGFDVVKRIEYYDSVVSTTVVRKRPHPYTVRKRP